MSTRQYYRFTAHCSKNLLLLSLINLLLLTGCQSTFLTRQSGLINKASEHQQRLALIIGNSQYKEQPLSNPVNDANAMATTLKQLGFRVILKTDVDQGELLKTIDDFGQALTTSDVGVFYYSGHAVQSQGKNYIIPLDYKAENTRLQKQLVSIDTLLGKMAQSGNVLNMVILDACRDNPLNDQLSEGKTGLAFTQNLPDNLLLAYATSPGKLAIDGVGHYSPYTRHLLKAIQEPDKPVELIFKDVLKGVKKETRGRQIPWLNSSLENDFYFSSGTWYEPESGMEFVKIPKGCFLMGSPETELRRKHHERQHKVCIQQPYYMGQYEVTQTQWKKITGDDAPTYFDPCADCPVDYSHWYETQDFIQQLNRKTSLKFRLPTEAEWEYAARAGTTTPFSTGDCISMSQANFNGLEKQEWEQYGDCPKSEVQRVEPAVAVGSYAPNSFGLYDMHGNVLEWTCSAYSENYSGQELRCGSYGTDKYVLRGGDWTSFVRWLRSAHRLWASPKSTVPNHGFRVILPVREEAIH